LIGFATLPILLLVDSPSILFYFSSFYLDFDVILNSFN
jgi:hypothetical protein